MEIVRSPLSPDRLKQAAVLFGDMVKAVVDVDRELLAVDAQMHSDLEALLLENGSKQSGLWGINIYPNLSGEDRIQFDSMINVRPSQNNPSRSVEDEAIRRKIRQVVKKWVNE